MAKTKEEKQQIVQTLAEKLAKVQSVVFADYQGLTMKQLSDLRNKLGEQDSQLLVTKNTLLKRALDEAQLPTPKVIEEGATATLFAYADELSPLKILAKTLKDVSSGKLKAGIFWQESMDSSSLEKLADLPTKPELQAKVVRSLSSPLYGMVGVLQANLRNLVYALDQIKQTRG